MRDCEKILKNGVRVFFLSGRQVSEEEYRAYYPAIEIKIPAPGEDLRICTDWKEPILSDALAVHEDQVPEMLERDTRLGVPTDYTSDGRPILRSRQHRAAYIRSRGMFDRDGGYSDPQRTY